MKEDKLAYGRDFYEQFHEESMYEGAPSPAQKYEAQCIIMHLLGRNLKQHKLLLDVGCGNGAIFRLIAEKANSRCVGIDISETAIRKARQIEPNSSFIIADATCLPLKSDVFDYVISNHNIEHILNHESAICEMSRVCKVGGRLYLATPNPKCFFAFREYQRQIGNIGGHVRLFTKEVLISKLQERGFKIDKFKFYWHIGYYYVYRHLLFLFNFMRSIFACFGKVKNHACNNSANNKIYRILYLVLVLDDELFSFVSSHLAYYLIATKT